MRSSHAQERERATNLEPVPDPVSAADSSMSISEQSVSIRGGTATSSNRLLDQTRRLSGMSRFVAGSGRITAPGDVKGAYTEDLTLVALEVCYK